MRQGVNQIRFFFSLCALGKSAEVQNWEASCIGCRCHCVFRAAHPAPVTQSSPECLELDFTRALQLAGIYVPGGLPMPPD